MQDELVGLMKTGTWELIPLPANKNVIVCKWGFIKSKSTLIVLTSITKHDSLQRVFLWSMELTMRRGLLL